MTFQIVVPTCLVSDTIFCAGIGNPLQSDQSPHAAASLPRDSSAPTQMHGNYPQQYASAASLPMSNPYSTPNARPAYGMPQGGMQHPTHAQGAEMPAGQRLHPSQPQSTQHPTGLYQPKPDMQGAQPGMPYAAQSGPYPAPSRGPHADPQQLGNVALQQQQGGYGPHQHSGRAPQSVLGPVHGPDRPPGMIQDGLGNRAQDHAGRRPEQNSRSHSSYNGMSESDVQAQQAERKRRFTEQKAQAQWQQVLDQQKLYCVLHCRSLIADVELQCVVQHVQLFTQVVINHQYANLLRSLPVSRRQHNMSQPNGCC